VLVNLTNQLGVQSSTPPSASKSSIRSGGKRRLVLLEYAPGNPSGYAINLLKCAALSNPIISASYDIICRTLSAETYPLENRANAHNRKDNALLCELLAGQPDVVGFSVFSWNVIFFSRLTAMLRLMAPKCRIIWGGKLATNDTERLARENTGVDCFCLGEGELVLQTYLISLLGDRPLGEPLPGTYMRIGGGYRRSSVQGELPELGKLPNPYIQRMIDPSTATHAYIETLRGCVYHCTFCDWGGKFYRSFDDDYICNVITACLEQRFEVIFFMDSIFAVEPKRRKKFLTTILDHYNNYSRLGFEIFIEHLDEESQAMFRELSRRGGIAKLEIGLQSGNPNTLRGIKRPHKRERFLANYNSLIREERELQDRIQIDLIIGLPGETWKTYGYGLNTIFSLDPGLISTFPLEVFPGSEMKDKQMESNGLIALEAPPYCIISTNTMSAFEIQELMCLSWMICGARDLIRTSLFFLHHATQENIFEFLGRFATWCVSSGRVTSWYDYGRIEDHVANMVDYICTVIADEGQLASREVRRLKQLLLFELAPFISVHSREIEFEALWTHPTHSADRQNTPIVASIEGEIPLGGYWFLFNDLIQYKRHPESHQEALDVSGALVAELIEVRGTSFRRRLFPPAEVFDLLRQTPADHIFLSDGVEAEFLLNAGIQADILSESA
jgi:hypothetical protein